MNKKNKKYIGFGERPSDKDFFKITKTQYDATPEQNIGNYELILNTPTVKAYLDRPVKTIMLSIRGTTDSRDVGADAMIPFNRLKYSNRYNEDKNIIANLATQYPPEDYDYYATGHSLGMALMRQLQREFPFIKNTVGFNGAIQPYDIIDQKANLNKSYYTEDDALYKLGGRLLNNKVVIPSTVHTLKIPGIIPSPAPVKVGQFVYNASQGHKLDNFEGVLGGAISRMREKLLKMTVKEIKEAVKNELNGAIKGYSKMKKEDLIDAIRDYQKRKKKHVEPIKSEEPKKATPTKKLSKKEEFEKDERHKKIIYLAEVIVDHLKTLNKWVLELKKYGKLHKYCRKYNKYNSTEEERQILEKYMKKYDSTCYRAGRNSDDTLSSIRNLVEKIKGMFNGYYNRNYYREWYQKNYPEEYKKLPMVYVKDNFNFHFFSYNITDDEKLKLKSLVNKLGMDYSDVEKLENEADIKGGSRCMCHVKHIVKGGAMEKREFNSFDDFKTTELRKIASIFNKFFKIKLTKLSRDEILNELEKYLILAENGSIFVNEERFFSLKPKAMIKEIEETKQINKLKREAKPKTRKEILQKEKVSNLKSLLNSLGFNPKGLTKEDIIGRILMIEFKNKKDNAKEYQHNYIDIKKENSIKELKEILKNITSSDYNFIFKKTGLKKIKLIEDREKLYNTFIDEFEKFQIYDFVREYNNIDN